MPSLVLPKNYETLRHQVAKKGRLPPAVKSKSAAGITLTLASWRLGVSFLLVVLGLCLAQSASAIQLVVLEARGVPLTVGQKIDGAATLALKDGQQATLVSPAGKLFKIKGPYEAAPAPDVAVAKTDVVDGLKTLIALNETRERAGVIRGAAPQPVPPEPWLIDITHAGTRCLPAGEPIVLWRPDQPTAVPVTVTPTDRSWKEGFTWQEGKDRMVLARVPVRERSTYVVKLADKEATLTLVAIPASVDNDAMKAAWMIEKGCDAQAHALLTRAMADATTSAGLPQ